eukprot:g14940.t1
MMGSDEAMMGSDDVREENNTSLLESLETEVRALRLSESSLIAELQRRCDKMIELEVHLDEERARANRLQRERTEEDEALSGELRDIMATVALDSANGLSLAAGAGVSSSDSAQETVVANESNGTTAMATATATAAAAEEPAEGQCRASEAAIEPSEPSGISETADKPPTAEESPAGFFAEWRARRARAARAESRANVEDGGAADDSSDKHAGTCAKAQPASAASGEKDEAEGRGARGDGGGELAAPEDRGRQQAAGALRARVVELELQRANAEDEMREKMDRSIRLEVQVEQLKNVVQSLSHASAQEETQGWDGKTSKGVAAAGKTPGTIDLDPLLQGVPGVDPHVLLLLHRSPWTDGVIEGIRKEETCFEWQGRDSRGEWSSKLCNLPAELSSLPFHSTGLPPPPPPTLQQRPANSTSTSASPPSSEDRHASVARKRAPSVGNGDVEPSEQEGVGTGGLKEKIGQAVAVLGAAGRGLGGSRAGAGARTVTDEGVTLRFELDNIGLPSEHWEWVGGWMVDSETVASADQDGWIYGRGAEDIAEIALCRKSASSRNVDDSYSNSSGGGRSRHSSSSRPSAKHSSSGGEGAAGSLKAGGESSPPKGLESGAKTSPPQQQKQQQESSVSGSPLQRKPVSPAITAGQQTDVGSNDQPQREKGGVKVKDGAGTAGTGSGGGDDGVGEEAGVDTEGSQGGGGGGGEGLWLRRRRLVRLRMVKAVDGARESTISILEMMRRVCSLEVLVKKLSSQVVSQQRQVTFLESQVAFLAPLHPKLKMACALGRKDRQRGNALQGRLIEAENEIKVLRRCLSASNPPHPAQRPRQRPRPVPITSVANVNANTNATGRQPLKPTGRLSAQELEEAGETSEPPGGAPEGHREGGGEGAAESGVGGGGDIGGRSVGVEAWGWVEGMAQRAAGTFARRSRSPAGSEAEEEVGLAKDKHQESAAA